MKDFIEKIITFYEMRANAMTILMANTQKALEQSTGCLTAFAPEGERIAAEQAERLNSLGKNLTINLNNMLKRFYFHKEHKRITSAQTRALADFANFTKTLGRDVRSLSYHFEKSCDKTFEKKFDKELKQMEMYVKGRLKGFGRNLDRHTKYLERKAKEVCLQGSKSKRRSGKTNPRWHSWMKSSIG
jgi:hypothetical protein